MKWLFRFLSIVLFVFFFGLAIKNTQEITLFFFFDYEITQSLVLILLCFFIAGGVLTYLVLVPNLLRDKFEIARQKKQLIDLEEEYNTFKTLVHTQNAEKSTEVPIHNDPNIT